MIDAWTGPTPTPQQFPHNEPDGIRKLLGLIKSIQAELRDVRSHLPGSTEIDNAMLTSPVAPGLVYRTISNFALSTTWTTLLTSTITVPPGFTQCVVSMSSRVFANNPNTTAGADGAGADYIYTRTNIASIYPDAFPILAAGSGHVVVVVDPYAQLLYGINGVSTFGITVEAKSTYLAWAANANNTVELSGSLQWFR